MQLLMVIRKKEDTVIYLNVTINIWSV